MTSKFDSGVLLLNLTECFLEARKENMRLRKVIADITNKVKELEDEESPKPCQENEPKKEEKSTADSKSVEKACFADKHQIMDNDDDYEYESRYVVDEMGIPYFECDD